MKKSIFFLLYFSEGAPIGFIWWALPAILSKQNFDMTTIATISSLAALPWTFKFLLAPLIDLLSMNKFSLKKQLLLYQVLMGVVLFFVPDAIQSHNSTYIILTLLIHGLFAASQDICIDSLAIKTIPEDELGATNGIMQAGMLVGRSILGGAGVYLANKFGVTYLTYFLISSIWISLLFLQKTDFQISQTTSVTIKSYFKNFYELISHKKFWLLIAVTYFSGFSYNGITTVASAVLEQKGISSLWHGITYSLFIPISMSIGAVVAGKLSDKLGAMKVLKVNLFICILLSIGAAVVMDYSNYPPVLIISYTLFYIFIGSSTASLYSFLMQNTNKSYAALEFSIFMAATNLSETSSSYTIGQLFQFFNYSISTGLIAFICLLTFPFLYSKRLKPNLP